MERIVLTNNIDIVKSNEEQFFLVDECVSQINIEDFVNANILFLTVGKEKELTIDIGRNSVILLSFLAKNHIDGYKITINVKSNSKIDAFFADFTKGKEGFKIYANLLEEGASIHWHLASLTAGNDDKTFDVSVNHKYINTYARMDNYGICKDDARLVFSGISSIENGAKGSKTHQNSKIMVFDKSSNGIAKPILKIDENDIEASHAAVVGKINDDHLFYLTSRGLSESEAKELITFGYLKPIINGFVEEEIKEEIISLIEGRM